MIFKFRASIPVPDGGFFTLTVDRHSPNNSDSNHGHWERCGCSNEDSSV